MSTTIEGSAESTRSTPQYLPLRIARNRRVRRVTFMDVMMILNLVLIAPAAVSYLLSGDQRRKERHFQAWQIIALAEGREWSGGRIDALQDLASDGVPLRRITLDGAHLRGLRIPGADLKGALLSRTDLTGALLDRTVFSRGLLVEALFYRSTLTRADLTFATADGANFTEASACGALFIGATLRHADFTDAELRATRFDGADLRGAKFTTTSVPAQATFEHANVAGLRAPTSFLEEAKLRGAVDIVDEAEWRQYQAGLEPALKSEWNGANRLRLLGASGPRALGCSVPPEVPLI